MKRSLLAILILLCFNIPKLSAEKNIPFFIFSQKNIFLKLAKNIKATFPKNVKILVYEIMLMNGSDELQKKINNEFNSVLSSLQEKYEYSVMFEKDIIKDHPEIDLSALKKQDELELISLSGYLKQDIVMLASVTVFEGKTRYVWDPDLKKIVSKNAALFQGNFFNETRDSLFRFSYYFLLD
jgi:hypothetical protein